MNQSIEKNIIPKKLHFIWVGGGQKTSKMLYCMESWKKLCPDFEIFEWNENNFDIEKSPLIKKGLKQKNWALAADAMRALILNEHGGIYIDTDVEILKPLDEFLNHEFFIGYESGFWANTALIGAVAGHPIVKTLARLYSSDLGLKMSNLMTVHILSALLKNYYGIKPNGKTLIHPCGVAVYARDWFYPQSYLTHKLKLTKNSRTIHYYSGTWGTEKQLKALKALRVFNFLYVPPIIRPLERIVAKRYRDKVNKVLRRMDKGILTTKKEAKRKKKEIAKENKGL